MANSEAVASGSIGGDHTINNDVAALRIQAAWRGCLVRRSVQKARLLYSSILAEIEADDTTHRLVDSPSSTTLEDEVALKSSAIEIVHDEIISTDTEPAGPTNSKVAAAEDSTSSTPEEILGLGSHSEPGSHESTMADDKVDCMCQTVMPLHIDLESPINLEQLTQDELFSRREELALELSWTEQAIKSREQYLALKTGVMT